MARGQDILGIGSALMGPAWLDRLERRVGGVAFPQLAAFIAAMNAAVWVLSQFKPRFPLLLVLEPSLVLRGQVWRVFTFLFIPPGLSVVFMFFWLYLLYTCAAALEFQWGEFRFNAYYWIGAASTLAASLLSGAGLSNVALNTTIFLAFAALYPDIELLLFFFLPVKVKWLAALAWLGIAWGFIAGGWADRLGLAAGLFNYALFFGRDHWESFKRRGGYHR